MLFSEKIGMNKTKICTSYIATKSLNLVEVPVQYKSLYIYNLILMNLIGER